MERRATAEIPKVISFRPAADQALALVEHARSKKLTPHALAHEMVIRSLQNADGLEEVSGHMQKLQHQLFELREELALVSEALLVSAGKLSKEAAQSWVDDNIKP